MTPESPEARAGSSALDRVRKVSDALRCRDDIGAVQF